ncbi:glycosyl transferase [Limosilactobacillus reuteri]|uniref:Glycosyl transferase n=1 Tax=Limosilactobacillus reuteri TaxID=1598 RepID=A0A1Y3UDH9_LIMRT|nr:glycosyltransferase [Limosilactobacillus reuteri]OUN46862.1 glycosyl transferase [Limosilactobacillus reuteri]OUP88456.1 glycosyl transferase [Limosilactobacillus reuteri]
MKKVLFIVEAMGGGVFTYIVDMANELSKKYDVYVAYGLRKQTPSNYRQYFNESVHLIYVKNFTRSINLRRDIKAFNEIKEIQKTINPDVIHLHSSKAGILGRVAFRNLGTPVFYTPHGYSFLMKNTSKVKRAIYYLLEKICANLTGKTIACSYGEYLIAKKLNKKATYVSNGINIKEIDSLLKNKKIEMNRKMVFGTLGRISNQKNPSLFNKIAKSFPNYTFKWIGDGEQRNLLTSSNIQVTGWLNRKDALNELASTDVFLLPSLWEGLPMSLLEAMYLKKVCIVSNIEGNNDVIKNGENGFVCSSINDYISIIKELRNDYCIDKNEIVENAYCNILNKYNTNVMFKKYSRIYELGDSF